MSRGISRDILERAQPTTLDRVVGYFDPERGARRMQARMSMVLGETAFKSASTARRNLVGFRPGAGDANADLANGAREIMRDRARDLVRNAPLATGAVNTMTTNVVGSGLCLKSRIDRAHLGISDEDADAKQTQIEREWGMWAESPECDLARTLNFYGLQEQVFTGHYVGGDMFVLLPFKERPGSLYGLKLQVIEGDRVSNPQFALDTTTLSGGVEKEGTGAPAAYWITDQHPGAINAGVNLKWAKYPAFGKTGRRLVLHVFRQLRPGQSRGYTELAAVIEPLLELGRYTEAELTAAVVSSMFTVFVTTPSGGGLGLPPGNPPAVDNGGRASDAQQGDVRMAPGAIVDMRVGETVDFANPGRPNTAFDPFVQAILRQVGVALGMPFEVLIQHYTASYSAARAALLQAWNTFRTRREWFAGGFCQPVFETWLDEAVARGRIAAPGYFADPMTRAAYRGAYWVGPARGMIDETKEVEAARLRIGAGLSTRSDEASALGRDWDDVVAQLKREAKQIKDAGIVLETSMSSTVTTSAPAPDAPVTPPGGSDLETT